MASSTELFTVSQVAKLVELDRAQVRGVLKGLGIQPRQAGSSLVLSPSEVDRVKEAVNKDRQASPA